MRAVGRRPSRARARCARRRCGLAANANRMSGFQFGNAAAGGGAANPTTGFNFGGGTAGGKKGVSKKLISALASTEVVGAAKPAAGAKPGFGSFGGGGTSFGAAKVRVVFFTLPLLFDLIVVAVLRHYVLSETWYYLGHTHTHTHTHYTHDTIP